MGNNSLQADIVHHADIIIHSVIAEHFGLSAPAVPENFRIGCVKYKHTPAVEDLNINVSYIFIWMKRSKPIVCPVPVGSKDIRQMIIRTIVHAYDVAVSALIAG